MVYESYSYPVVYLHSTLVNDFQKYKILIIRELVIGGLSFRINLATLWILNIVLGLIWLSVCMQKFIQWLGEKYEL